MVVELEAHDTNCRKRSSVDCTVADEEQVIYIIQRVHRSTGFFSLEVWQDSLVEEKWAEGTSIVYPWSMIGHEFAGSFRCRSPCRG